MKLSPVELLEYQPNRYPFLMLDRVDEVIPGQYARGVKNLTWNEWFFPQHFPGSPNVPGALQLEAMAQLLTVALTTLPGLKGKITHALSHRVSFRKEIIPGDTLVLEANLISWSRGIAKGVGRGLVEGEVACEAEMKIAIPEILKRFSPLVNK